MLDPNKMSILEIFNAYPIDPPVSMFLINKPQTTIQKNNIIRSILNWSLLILAAIVGCGEMTTNALIDSMHSMRD